MGDFGGRLHASVLHHLRLHEGAVKYVKTCLLFYINNQSKALVIVLLKIEYWENLIAYSIYFFCFGTFIEVLKARGRIKASKELVRYFRQESQWLMMMNETAFELYRFV